MTYPYKYIYIYIHKNNMIVPIITKKNNYSLSVFRNKARSSICAMFDNRDDR